MAWHARALEGCLIGMAVGDSLGLPREGLKHGRDQILFGPDLRQHFFFGRGMVSDDTEHAMMTVQAFLRSGGNEERFLQSLAWSLRGWLLGLPAGVGLATLKATVRLWFGVPRSRSGVNSAGNGPAMRAPVLGVLLAHDQAGMLRFVKASTKLTHVHPLALEGAAIIAYAAAVSSRGEVVEGRAFFDAMQEDLTLGPEWKRPFEEAVNCLECGHLAKTYSSMLDLSEGISGYILHTVPACLYCWLANQRDFRKALHEAIGLGGDTDTVGAITGGIVGAGVGIEGIPQEWVCRIWEWPRSVGWMRKLASGCQPLPWFWPAQLPRNLLFLATVLVHGVRRVLPPYS